MKTLEIKFNDKTIAKNVLSATSFFSRLRGMMFYAKFEDTGFGGMLIQPCNSIHNFFVRFPIDVVFLTSNNVVVKVIRGFKPWRITRIYFSADKVLEVKEDTLPEDLKKGDMLEVVHV